jgi:hypothetical protein
MSLSQIQDPITSTIRWRCSSGGSSNIVLTIFTAKAGEHRNYGLMPLHSPVIVKDENQKSLRLH